MAKELITQEKCRELFEYREDGHLYWKVQHSTRIKIGTRAGYFSPQSGYIYIRYFRLYREHILIWLYHNGKYPDNKLDHKNRVRDDNRIDNLRDVTDLQNSFNTSLRKDNTTGYKGVSKRSDRKYRPFRAELKIGDLRVRAGTYKTAEEAALAYNNLAILHFGEFANLNVIN